MPSVYGRVNPRSSPTQSGRGRALLHIVPARVVLSGSRYKIVGHLVLKRKRVVPLVSATRHYEFLLILDKVLLLYN